MKLSFVFAGKITALMCRFVYPPGNDGVTIVLRFFSLTPTRKNKTASRKNKVPPRRNRTAPCKNFPATPAGSYPTKSGAPGCPEAGRSAPLFMETRCGCTTRGCTATKAP